LNELVSGETGGAVAGGARREAGDERWHVTFVCSGNICRSPMGEVVLRRLLEEAGIGPTEVSVGSAATTAWQVGNPADPRTVSALRRRGYDGSAHVARQFLPEWFDDADLVLAADSTHVWALRGWARSPQERATVRLMREFDPAALAAGKLEVDDPWYGTEADFERCLTEVEASCRGLVAHLRGRQRE